MNEDSLQMTDEEMKRVDFLKKTLESQEYNNPSEFLQIKEEYEIYREKILDELTREAQIENMGY